MSGEAEARELARLAGHVLSAPQRLAVMLLLVARGGMEFGELARALGVSPGSLWHHVERLRREGYVRTRYRLGGGGPRLVVEPTDTGIGETLAYVRRLIALLGGRV